MGAAPHVLGSAARQSLDFAVPASTDLVNNATTSNSTCAVTLAAVTVPNRPHIIAQVFWSYSGAATGGRLTITTGSSVVFDVDITAAGPGSQTFTPPLCCFAGSETVIRLYPGGSVTGKLCVNAYNLD